MPPQLELSSTAELFLQRNMVREATAFLLDALSPDLPQHAVLQTKLLEINLIQNPQVSLIALSLTDLRQHGIYISLDPNEIHHS